MKFDQVSKDLMAGARLLEQRGWLIGDPHLLRAVSAALQRPNFQWRSAEHRQRYYAAANRVFDALGLDNADLSLEEAIDGLVAAAFWTIP